MEKNTELTTEQKAEAYDALVRILNTKFEFSISTYTKKDFPGIDEGLWYGRSYEELGLSSVFRSLAEYVKHEENILDDMFGEIARQNN